MLRFADIMRNTPVVLAVAALAACSDSATAPQLDGPAVMPDAASLARESSYEAIRLGTLFPGDFASFAFALNNRDQVVGRSWYAREPGVEFGRAFLWTPDGPNAQTGEMIPLPVSFAGVSPSSAALDINDRGVVVGWSSGMMVGGQFAMMWVDGVGTTLPGSQAVAINNRGYVVLQTGSEVTLWTPPGANGSATAETYPIGTFSARAINDRGEIVGSSGGQAVVWRPDSPGAVTGTLTPLGSLGGSTVALDINDKGEIVGYGMTASGATHAFLWEPTHPHATSGELIDLHAILGATTFSRATAINGKGEVAGVGFFPSTSNPSLFVWRSGPNANSNASLTLIPLIGGFADFDFSPPLGPDINDRGDLAFYLGTQATLWRR